MIACPSLRWALTVVWACVLATVIVSAGLASHSSSGSLSRLDTAVVDPFLIGGPQTDAALAKVRGAGATFVRLPVNWDEIAPGGAQKPAGFDASNPDDPQYVWGNVDREVMRAVAANLTPILNVAGAPAWAQSGVQQGGLGPVRPEASELGLFAHALATRYDGSHDGLPSVRYYQIWNEPNITPFLMPQFVHGKDASPGIYRAMVNTFAAAVHKVDGANRVVAGGLSPFTVNYPTVKSIGPLKFMRELFARPVRFDIWAAHPYTTGGPFHHATNPNDVSLGDLPKMHALLEAALKRHAIVAPHGLGFWVTEFSWDTDPPDPNAVPINLQARWVAEALYQMWRSGVTLVAWWLLQDRPLATSPNQSGFYTYAETLAAAHPKPSLVSFRFPFVAYLRTGGVYVWARTPWGRPGVVTVQLRQGGSWHDVARLRTNANGIVSTTLAVIVSKTDAMRAQFGADQTLTFSLTEPPDHPYRPFG